MARPPASHRLRTVAATRAFVGANHGLQGLVLLVRGAEGLESAGEMLRALEPTTEAMRTWTIHNRRLLRAGANLYGTLMEAVRHARGLRLAVRDRFARAFRGEDLPGAMLLPLAEAKALRAIRRGISSTRCRAAKKGAKMAGNRLRRLEKSLKEFDGWFVDIWTPDYLASPPGDRAALLRVLKNGCVRILGEINELCAFVSDDLVKRELLFPVAV